MEIRLILVSPKYQLNVGYIARIAKNFGVEQLYFVKPRANIHGNNSTMYSKHAKELLDTAIIYNTFKEAADNCDVLLGTSGIFRNNIRFGSIYTPRAALKKIKKEYREDSVIGIAIGRDDTGLSIEELELCDLLVHIDANPEYPILNISHSIAVLLYEFKQGEFSKKEKGLDVPEKLEIEKLLFSFNNLIKNKKIRDKKAVERVFRKMLRKAQLDRHELHSLISAFKE